MSFAVVLMYSCSREIDMPEVTPMPERQMKEVILDASVESDSETRTVLRNGKIYWQYGDQISLFYGNGSNGGYRFINNTAGESLTSQFSGMIDAIEGGSENATDAGEKQFIGVFPYRDDIVCDGSTITTTLPDVQTAVEGSFDRDLFISMGRSPGLTMKFYNVCAGILFTVSHPNIFQIEFSGNAGEVLAGQVKVGFDANGKPEVKQILDGKTKITVNAPNGGEFEVGKTYCLVTLPVQMSASMKMSFIKTDVTSGLRKWQKADIKFERNELKTYYPIDADDKTTFFEAVDLGGSVLWATKNVGAAEVGDYGEFYRWGEVTPYSGGSSYSGASSTNNMALSPEDDAASVNWGGYWRMPTTSELMELSSMPQELDTENNHSGIRFGEAPNSIFVPFAGLWLRNSSDAWYQNTLGYLLSSEKDSDNQLVQLSLYNYSDNLGSGIIYGSGYDNGYSVRPVLSKPVAATSVVLNKTSVRMNVGATEQLTVTVLPDNAFRKGVRWTSSNTSVASVSATGMISANGEGTVTITATSADGAASATCDIQVIISETMGWVDMGDGHFWATCNVGAELPTDAGDRFAWGETTPKESYSWVNYHWLTPNYITKYQAEDNNYQALWYTGYAGAFNGDGITILEPEDDAAAENWNSEWQMPTRSEWQWLYDHSEMVATTENGVPGVRVTSTVPGYTQNSIFLPYGTQGLNCANGGYWSSSLRVEKTETAHKMSIANGADGWTTLWFDTREKGYMVRPVRVPSVRVTGVTLDQSSIFFPWIRKTQTLTATVTPANAAMPDVVWNSSNPDVATVSLDGVVTAVSFGEATITATTVDGEMTASCEVTVQCWSGVESGHKYVDMGGGLKWAVCNLNNSGWDDDNVHFLWMETDPWARGSFYEHTELWDNTTGDFVSYIGGEPWRRPELADYKWLMNNCDWEFTTENGMNGVLVTSQETQRCLFLPMAGYFDSGDSFRTDEGYYWAAVPGQCLIIRRNSRITMGGQDDSQGMLVRPVFGWLPESEYQ